MKVISKNISPLLNREELVLEIDINGVTPKKEDIKKKIVQELKVDENLVAVKKILSEYGGGEVKVIVYNYKDKKSFDSIEIIKKKAKKEKPKEVKKE